MTSAPRRGNRFGFRLPLSGFVMRINEPQYDQEAATVGDAGTGALVSAAIVLSIGSMLSGGIVGLLFAGAVDAVLLIVPSLFLGGLVGWRMRTLM
ncbi:Undecaprenyl-phosphate N-acetylglucosaminyl 1-phosphate transferase [Hyphomicrobiales bacterium]|nr:Undecaprenyl-phosphate N-acetylglucosaminyl 1-phosphate transferase [Hyphomicrobiales bacterium]CAH1701053.1 Undecaprenyl-phosphate N-acetylglucosaminyl 1-phosphate transferase [Hyphomicrobiales bacterium]CAI0344112.1 hypothetical protein BO1005MUT1_310141 [Hyphomicrobiales bacterium]